MHTQNWTFNMLSILGLKYLIYKFLNEATYVKTGIFYTLNPKISDNSG